MDNRHPPAVATQIMASIRSQSPTPMPIRLIHHLPEFERLMRLVNPFEVLSLSKKMFIERFRSTEPITVLEPLFKFENVFVKLPCYILAGNHRLACARDSLTHLVCAQVLNKDHVMPVYQAVKDLHMQAQNRPLSDELVREMLFEALKFLVVISKTRGLSPASYSALQQVLALRTMVYSDPGVPKPYSKDKKVYEGYKYLRKRFFGREEICASDTHDRSNFLYNGVHCARHMNRQLLGCMRLFETDLSQPIPFVGHETCVLDILVLLENHNLMPLVKDTHIGNAGELNSKKLIEIIETCVEGLRSQNSMVASNGALKFSPLCTPFIKAVKVGSLTPTIIRLTIQPKRQAKRVREEEEELGGKKIARNIKVPEDVAQKEKYDFGDHNGETGSETLSGSIRHDGMATPEKKPSRKNKGLHSMKQCLEDFQAVTEALKQKESRERSLLELVQSLKDKIHQLRAEKMERSSKSRGTRRLGLRIRPHQLENLTREELCAMKTEIDNRLSKMK